MSYAVVKFLNEKEDDDEELVSEVPFSWLSADKQFCKWPPGQYASIYIAKNVAPCEDWEEHRIELEFTCDTLAEAKQRAKSGKPEEKIGRGFRQIKPIDYFSPAEEEDKEKQKKRKKHIPTVNENVVMPKFDYVSLLGDSVLHNIETEESETTPTKRTNRTDGVLDLEEENLGEDGQDEDHLNSTITPLGSSDSAGSQGNFATLVVDQDIQSIHSKLEKILNMLVQLKIDVMEIRERINEENTVTTEQEKAFPTELPLQTLPDIEALEAFVKTENGKQSFMNYVKSIGGKDAKDFITRVLKNVFANGLAELCSWTGRKNNFQLGHLQIMRYIFGVVKNKCTAKEYELHVAEWFRHAKQRLQREQNNAQKQNIVLE